MDSLPLVSVICLCYNQKAYVGAAIRSVLSQTYKSTELIVVDDGSTDGSKEVIRELLKDTDIAFIDLGENMGNCKAFNQGFRISKGDFIIDLAADDLLLPGRIEEGVNDFARFPGKAGVHFSDAFLINSEGGSIDTHYRRDASGTMIDEVPSGNIYRHLISRYFISPPTMMIRREVLEILEGYDESLTYEDFDFWIRSSREFDYIFNKAPLVKKRILKSSHSRAQYALRNKHQHTTYRVCEKIFDLNRTADEDMALIGRCHYEIRQCILTLNLELIPGYLHLRKKTYRRLSSASSIDK